MSWALTAGLAHLRDQVNKAFPHRDKASDGTIGDAAHQAETSGHNPDDTAGSKAEWNGDPDSTPEVRAWDMDSNLGHPGVTAQDLVDHLRRLPGLSSEIRYMIYNRHMYHSRDGFAPTPYTGASAHTEHIHFSGAWTQASDNNTTFDYRLEELIDMTPADLLNTELVDPTDGKKYKIGDYIRYGEWNMREQAQAAVKPLADRLTTIETAVSKLATPAPIDYDKLAVALLRNMPAPQS